MSIILAQKILEKETELFQLLMLFYTALYSKDNTPLILKNPQWFSNIYLGKYENTLTSCYFWHINRRMEILQYTGKMQSL